MCGRFALYNRGNALQELNRFDEATTSATGVARRL